MNLGFDVTSNDIDNANKKRTRKQVIRPSISLLFPPIGTVVEEEEAKTAESPEKSSEAKTAASPEKSSETKTAASPEKSPEADTDSKSEKSPTIITQVSLHSATVKECFNIRCSHKGVYKVYLVIKYT